MLPSFGISIYFPSWLRLARNCTSTRPSGDLLPQRDSPTSAILSVPFQVGVMESRVKLALFCGYGIIQHNWAGWTERAHGTGWRALRKAQSFASTSFCDVYRFHMEPRPHDWRTSRGACDDPTSCLFVMVVAGKCMSKNNVRLGGGQVGGCTAHLALVFSFVLYMPPILFQIGHTAHREACCAVDGAFLALIWVVRTTGLFTQGD